MNDTIILTQIVNIAGHQVTMEFAREDNIDIMNEVQNMLISSRSGGDISAGGIENDMDI